MFKFFYNISGFFIPHLDENEKEEVAGNISDATTPNFDYYLLVVLSCSIATLGLLTNSPAVIIGAMLIAPLMSSIIGMGLAVVTSDNQLLSKSLSTLLRGIALAILLSLIVAIFNRIFPFIVLSQLPEQVLTRSRPTPIDLAIALAGGIAAAYSMTRKTLSAALPGVAIATALMPPLCTVGIGIAFFRWDIALGALVLFLTNAVTITFAAAMTFLFSGFSPRSRHSADHLKRNLIISAILLLVIFLPLAYYSYTFVRKANDNRQIITAVTEAVGSIANIELVDINQTLDGNALNLVLTIRTNNPLRYEQVVEIQDRIVQQLGRTVSLQVNQVFAERLDPLVPPTPTATPKPGITPSPVPTATAVPTRTPVPTPTPGSGIITQYNLPALKLYQQPGGPVIGEIKPGQEITVMGEEKVFEGLMWTKVADAEGRVGWIPKVTIQIRTATPTQTATPMP